MGGSRLASRRDGLLWVWNPSGRLHFNILKKDWRNHKSCNTFMHLQACKLFMLAWCTLEAHLGGDSSAGLGWSADSRSDLEALAALVPRGRELSQFIARCYMSITVGWTATLFKITVPALRDEIFRLRRCFSQTLTSFSEKILAESFIADAFCVLWFPS